METLEPHIEW